MARRPGLILSFSVAIRSALTVGLVTLACAFARVAIEWLFDHNYKPDISLILKVTTLFSGAWFLLVFVWTYFRTRTAETEDRIIEEDLGQRRTRELAGFVAMEYYFLILNRTFLVFIAREGLYGWKVEGAVTTQNPSFYEPYAGMLKDKKLMTSSESALKELVHESGGFFIPQSQISSVDYICEPKWGMGPIVHSGRLKLKLASGESKELILLGPVDGEPLRQKILQPQPV